MTAMTFDTGVRILILILAVAVAAAGVLVMTGVLVREGMSPELRVTLGAVVFLYGIYKFTITWFRRPGRKGQ